MDCTVQNEFDGRNIMTLRFVSRARLALAAGVIVALAGILGRLSAAEDLGPPVGTKAPDIGMRLDQTGKPRGLNEVMGPNGLVLMFFRSADWCPYCQAQLIDMNGGNAEIEKRGYRVAALSYDSPEILQTFTSRRHIAYTFLSDPKSEVIDLYKLRDPQYPPGSRAYGVPRPIIFILDKNGVVKAKLFEESFKIRPPVTAVISRLDELAKGS
jgi:peroxiredoxin